MLAFHVTDNGLISPIYKKLLETEKGGKWQYLSKLLMRLPFDMEVPLLGIYPELQHNLLKENVEVGKSPSIHQWGTG